MRKFMDWEEWGRKKERNKKQKKKHKYSKTNNHDNGRQASEGVVKWVRIQTELNVVGGESKDIHSFLVKNQ